MRWAKDNLWLDMPLESGPALFGAHEVDVAIIGGGFTGLAASYFIKRRSPTKRVLVLESEFVGFGSSGRNTGISGATLGHSLLRLQKKFGTVRIAPLQKLSQQSFLLIEELIKEHRIDCDYERNGLMVIVENEKEIRLLEKEAKACEQVGAKAIWLDKAKAGDNFGGLKPPAALYHPEQGILNPAKFARGMKRVVESLGVEVYEHSRCTHVETGPTVSLYTSNGIVRATNVVIATNAYGNPLGLLRRKVLPFYVYNIATEPLTKQQMDEFHWPGRSAVFNLRNLFWVIRLTADNRVVFVDSDALYFYDIDRDYSHRPSEYRSHYRVLTKLFPFLKGIKTTHAWGGRIGLTMNHLPSIGCTGRHRNIFYALGFNGHGVAFSQIAGKMLAELIAGEKTELTDHMLLNKSIMGVPTAFLSYLAVNGYKLTYKFDDWLVDFGARAKP